MLQHLPHACSPPSHLVKIFLLPCARTFRFSLTISNTSLCLHYTSLLSVLGQLHWLYTAPESERNWAVVHDLVQGVLYELRVVARNGDEEDAPETSSPVRRIRLGSKIGECARVELGRGDCGDWQGRGWGRVTLPRPAHPQSQGTPSLTKDNFYRIRLISKRGEYAFSVKDFDKRLNSLFAQNSQDLYDQSICKWRKIRLSNVKTTDSDWFYSIHHRKLKFLIYDLLFTSLTKNLFRSKLHIPLLHKTEKYDRCQTCTEQLS